MIRPRHLSYVLLAGAVALCHATPAGAAKLAQARIFIEYNAADEDLGFHVFLDGEDWESLKILNPLGATVFQVSGKGPFGDLGMTELFVEGAEPSLADVPLDVLLGLFPEGSYTFTGTRVDGVRIRSLARLSHAVPEGPAVSSEVEDDEVVIRWTPASGPPPGFPARPVTVVGYQVIVGSFQVTLPATSTEVTLPPEFTESLAAGEHGFEVLAIEAGGNQTISAGSFEID